MHRFVYGNVKYNTSIIKGQSLILPKNIKSGLLEKNQKKIYFNKLKENNETLQKIINEKKIIFRNNIRQNK